MSRDKLNLVEWCGGWTGSVKPETVPSTIARRIPNIAAIATTAQPCMRECDAWIDDLSNKAKKEGLYTVFEKCLDANPGTAPKAPQMALLSVLKKERSELLVEQNKSILLREDELIHKVDSTILQIIQRQKDAKNDIKKTTPKDPLRDTTKNKHRYIQNEANLHHA